MTDYYKNHLSDFLSWDQLSHAEDYILFPENLGPELCIDETALSNGELVTNVINKSGHGKRGTLVAIIKGTKSEDIVKCLKKIPLEQREQVKSITLDMVPVRVVATIIARRFPTIPYIITTFLHFGLQWKREWERLCHPIMI